MCPKKCWSLSVASSMPVLPLSSVHYNVESYSMSLYRTQLYSTLLNCTLHYSTVLYATLRYSTLIYCTLLYYMASSVSGQDESNPALWLATRAGKMELAVVSCKKNFRKSHIINPLLTKLVRSRWLDIGLVLFWRVYGPQLRLGP